MMDGFRAKAARVRRDRANNAVFNCAVWLIALWASLFNLFNHHSYPLFNPETVPLLAGLVVVAGLMGALRKVAGPRIGFLVTGMFAATIVDLNSSI
jgi:hypothetical protein